MKWLRLYHEARTDAKLESLPDDEFRVWFKLLCFANEQNERGIVAEYSERLLAVEVARGDVELLERTLTSLEELRIIERGEKCVAITNWDKRQRRSDDVSERVQQHRERQTERNSNDDVTLHSRDVTPPEEEEEADTETERDTEAVAAANAHALNDDERFVVDKIKQVRGMQDVTDQEISECLREVLQIRGSPVSSTALKHDAIRFRDYWNDKRQNQPKNRKWSKWRSAISSWFQRTTEPTTFSNGTQSTPVKPKTDLTALHDYAKREGIGRYSHETDQ